MSLSRPNARITIDGTTLGADEAALLRLQVDLAVNGSHDQVSLTLWPRSKFADAAAGATMDIALGERDSEEAVWTGELSARRLLPQAVVIEGLAATVALSRTAKSQSYLNQSVADIVRDLAGSAPVDQVDAGLSLHAYHVDNRRPVWSHLRALARLVGADIGSAANGGLRFVPAAGALSPVTLRYGAELLDWNLSLLGAPQAAEVAAYGSASESGASRWHWLAHDPVGAGAATTRVPAALSTRDAAQAVSDASRQRAERAAVSGELLIQGRPALRPGDAVQLSDLPGGDPGVLRVRSVRHSFDATSGFLTRLRVEGGEGGLGSGLPGGLP
jgi:phage protein D